MNIYDITGFRWRYPLPSVAIAWAFEHDGSVRPFLLCLTWWRWCAVWKMCDDRSSRPPEKSITRPERAAKLPRNVLEALESAAQALEDLGACDDPNCGETNCTHALAKVLDVLAEQ